MRTMFSRQFRPFLTAIAGATLLPVFASAVGVVDFQKAEVGKPPADVLIVGGDFKVAEEGSERFLELPGAPLDTFGLLFGTAPEGDVTAGARFFGTKQGRKFPTFAVSLNGVGGYRLQISPAKRALEFYRGDQPVVSVPYEWKSGEWVSLKISVRKSPEGWTVEGKAWSAGESEPANWMIQTQTADQLPAGRAGIWGAPYSGSPIRFDDLSVQPAKP